MLILVSACAERSEQPAAAPTSGKAVTGDLPAGAPPARDRLPEPPPVPPPAIQVGGLLPLSRETIERELASGAGCSLDFAPGPLLVAVAGDAIVNDGGRVVHLKPEASDLGTLAGGGRFVGDGLVVEIDREFQVETVDEVTTWQATLHVKRGRQGFTSYHHRWTCGA